MHMTEPRSVWWGLDCAVILQTRSNDIGRNIVAQCLSYMDHMLVWHCGTVDLVKENDWSESKMCTGVQGPIGAQENCDTNQTSYVTVAGSYWHLAHTVCQATSCLASAQIPLDTLNWTSADLELTIQGQLFGVGVNRTM
jgi:hypothetical protein